ncbi:MAG: alpha-2-macroglobulin family protein [Flavobacteriaceae bacterium]|nr:alpha-2-macroglobulin family protein [Flavobacteriaceae bacterium]
MKKAIFVLFALSFTYLQAQKYPFPQKWKEVETQLNEGKLKSVEPLLNEIMEKSRKENNSQNLIKALLFKSNLAIQTSDDENIVAETNKNFREEIAKSSGVEKAVLQSLLAELYFNYLQENQYRIIHRTDLAADGGGDFRTWDVARFLKETDLLLQASIEPKDVLQKTKTENFELLLEGEDKWRFLRPNMLDVLAHRALEIYQNPLFENQEFLQTEKEQKIEKIYADLIQIHQNDREPSALIENELEQLKYTFKNQQHSPEFRTELEKLYQKHADKSWVTNVLYELALTYTNGAEEENNYVKAIELCDQAIRKHPDSVGAQKCGTLKEQIEFPELSFETDGTLYAGNHNPLYISHKNTDIIYYRVYQLDKNQLAKNLNGFNFDHKTKKLLTVGEPIKTGQISLKKFTDYKLHTTTFPFEPLSPGNYILILSNNTAFTGNLKNHLFQTHIISTGLDLATRGFQAKNENFNQGQLVFKENGLPFKNKTLQILKSDRESSFTHYKTAQTDDFGRFDLKGEERNYYFNYVVKTADEATYFPVGLHSYRHNWEKDDWNEQTVFFTDRGIYRPGQTVYFKAILYKSKGKERKIQPNEKVEIILEDVNGEEVAKLDLISNEFGSVHGEFVLPTTGLTGIFTLTDDWGDAYQPVQVEEYKRPKFRVEMDTLKGVYQLNQKVKVSGNAQMFSGANLTDAKVVYRVYRQAYFPYRGWWWRPFPQEPEVEMTQGETTTDDEGNFNFEFEALPAKPKQPKQNRAYIYKIVADVVDISGETHTGNASVRIGDIPFQINVEVKEKVESTDFHSVKIITTNLNGAETEASGKLEITEILPLDRVLRHQQKEIDYELVPKSEFSQKLPYISYANEHLIPNRKRGNTVVNLSWNTSETDSVVWKQKLAPGTYEVKATSIYQNDTIESVRIVEVYHKNQNINSNEYFSVVVKNPSLQPGETAAIVFSSDAPQANVLVELEANGEIIRKEILNLEKDKTFSFPVTEDYRGGVFVHYYFQKFNESVTSRKTIAIPFENKKLDITTSVLRNKLEPGQEESWTLTIKDKKGDKFLAEVLAGMYDKSLDEFVINPWEFFPFHENYSIFNAWNNPKQTYFTNYNYRDFENEFPQIFFEDLNLYNLNFNEFRRNRIVIRGVSTIKSAAPPVIQEEAEYAADSTVGNALAGEVAGVAVKSKTESAIEDIAEEKIDLGNVQVRKNLQETAFFFPNLKTDTSGNVKIEFTAPESLTAWNFQTVAHTKDLQVGTFQSEIVTQKELMVVPNAPRFLREGDELLLKTKIINLSEKTQSGNAQLLLFDAFTMQPIEAKFALKDAQKSFSVNADGNTTVEWRLKIPKVDEVQSVVYRVVAGTGDFSDGEENALPILTNRMMVTETLPMSVRENQTKTFTFDKLKNSTSNTRENFKLTMEMTANPIWYAVMALPYLREYPYECSEQIFARLYGNLISEYIVNSNPKIKAVFDDWNRKGQLISPLEKNQELKNILLEETPWVRDAQNEEEQMKRIAVLFDLNKMRNELAATYQKLRQKQSPSGGFPWFEGGKDNVYITTHIVAGFGHLKQMQIPVNAKLAADSEEIPHKAIGFIDAEMEERWNKFQTDKKRWPLTGYDGIYWLYARSYYLQSHPLNAKLQKARDYFLTEMDKDKFNQGLQTQGMLALVYQRYGKQKQANELIFSIKDRAVESDEMGMYWKENVSGYRWWEAPVETQALLIEAFDEITPKDVVSVESMKVWLLKNKQTHQWTSTKATTEAVFALMNTGKDWTNAEEGVTVKIGNDIWYSAEVKPVDEVQSGSGYVKESWDKGEISPEMGTVTISKTSPGVAWGAMYWQYFEDLDKISGASTNVRFNKQLFIQRNTPQGPKLFEISGTHGVKTNNQIQVGDLVKVRLEIQTDRAMEFVHIKDMRASGFEPVNVISAYKWQDGLGYYESTRDAATNFFIDYLPKGVYVFEYDLRANNAGEFSNGITQLQNMYAPEFTAHSEGIRVLIE